MPGVRHAFPPDAVRATAEPLVAELAVEHPSDPIRTLVFSCLGTAMAPWTATGARWATRSRPPTRDRSPRPACASGSRSRMRPVRPHGLRPAAVLLPAPVAVVGRDPAPARWSGRIAALPAGVIAAAWTGADAEDPSWASRTMVMDLATDAWSPAILGAAGLDGRLLPRDRARHVRMAGGRGRGAAPGAGTGGAGDPGRDGQLLCVPGRDGPRGGPPGEHRGHLRAHGGRGGRAGRAGGGRGGGGPRPPLPAGWPRPVVLAHPRRVDAGRVAAAAGPGGLDRSMGRRRRSRPPAAIALDVDAVRATLAAGEAPGGGPPGGAGGGRPRSWRATRTRGWRPAAPRNGSWSWAAARSGPARSSSRRTVLGRPVSTLETDEAAGLGRCGWPPSPRTGSARRTPAPATRTRSSPPGIPADRPPLDSPA